MMTHWATSSCGGRQGCSCYLYRSLTLLHSLDCYVVAYGVGRGFQVRSNDDTGQQAPVVVLKGVDIARTTSSIYRSLTFVVDLDSKEMQKAPHSAKTFYVANRHGYKGEIWETLRFFDGKLSTESEDDQLWQQLESLQYQGMSGRF
eukprot:c5303_g2_i1 orf=165-602(-)